MKLLLLFLGLALFCSHGEGSEVVKRNFDLKKLSGKWHSIFLASDNMEKIEENGSMRLFVEYIQGLKNSSLSFKFHAPVNGECTELHFVGNRRFNNIYTVMYDGFNIISITETDYDTYIILHLRNIKNFKTFQKLELLGREPDVSPEVKNRFRELAKEKGISEENIVDLTSADTCLEAQEEV
ncbi:allergen Fel d 4-like [Octodon degus]|uniref:Allergen Fel d 4-like n=1 Tax=Octodon degus TaxID=10160 RepID=A0A6P3V8L3_OCTDE|nr:allergen Fel d 4-like [Octodon degus]